MKAATLIFLMLLAAASLFGQIETDPASGTVFAGSKIGFRPVCADSSVSQYQWNWDDGSPVEIDTGDAYLYFRYHTYTKAGSYTVTLTRIYLGTPMCPMTETRSILVQAVAAPSITFTPLQPRVDQKVTFTAKNFTKTALDWEFGDGEVANNAPTTVTHRYKTPGKFTVKASEVSFAGAPAKASTDITILPDIRTLTADKTAAKNYEPITFTANNFYSASILWNFGDGTTQLGGKTVSHTFNKIGAYTVAARDDAGLGVVPVTLNVKILAVTDEVGLDVAELTFENGRYYQVVPRKARNLRAVLRLKMSGTGIVTGEWRLDGATFALFNETAYEGQVKNILTPLLPGLPTTDPGVHSLEVKLTRPAPGDLRFPVLKYYVLPYENLIAVAAPGENALLQGDKPPTFKWEPAFGVVSYQIGFGANPFLFLEKSSTLKWQDLGAKLNFVPDAVEWQEMARKKRIYWQVRGLDGSRTVMAQSAVGFFQIVPRQAKIAIDRVTDMDGRPLPFSGESVSTRADAILVQGEIVPQEDYPFLVLRIFHQGEMTDQLAFRDLKAGQRYRFETAVACGSGKGAVQFQVLQPAAVPESALVGYAELVVK